MLTLQVLVSGIAQGCIYGLIALGFVLIYKATETVNFAHGDLMMLGAFSAFATLVVLDLPVLVGVFVAVALMACFGAALERILIRPVLGQPAISVVMLTLGIGYAARSAITMIPAIGTETHALPMPYKGSALRIGELVVAGEHIVVVVVTLLLCAGLYVMFRYLRIGVAMQAASQNQLAAYCMGIPVHRLNAMTWGLAAALATVAGILLAPVTFVHANMGFLGLKALPAAIIGGFSSLPGAIVGGLVIGVSESLSGYFLPDGIKDVVPYVLVLLVLLIKPTGLFGDKVRKKV